MFSGFNPLVKTMEYITSKDIGRTIRVIVFWIDTPKVNLSNPNEIINPSKAENSFAYVRLLLANAVIKSGVHMVREKAHIDIPTIMKRAIRFEIDTILRVFANTARHPITDASRICIHIGGE